MVEPKTKIFHAATVRLAGRFPSGDQQLLHSFPVGLHADGQLLDKRPPAATDSDCRIGGCAMTQFEVGQRRSVQEAGAYVLQRLSDELPALVELLDRDVFLARSRQLHTSVLARVVLTLDRCDAAAVEAAVEPLIRNPALASAFDRRFAEWAQQYGR